MKIGRYIFLRHGGKVVFFGRLVAVLRTYAAFLAGTNRMSWPRFLAFNAAGGITWATAIGVASYSIGDAVKHVAGPLNIVLAIAAAVLNIVFAIVAALLIIVFLLYRRAAEDRYAARAEQEFPGRLEDAPRRHRARERPYLGLVTGPGSSARP